MPVKVAEYEIKIMEDKKKYYQDLYNRYMELDQKTRIEALDFDKSRGMVVTQSFSIEDLKELGEIRANLFDGLEFLSNDELLSLWDDTLLRQRVFEILRERK